VRQDKGIGMKTREGDAMFLGYCLNPADQSWTPPVHLATAEEAFHYCRLHHGWIDEIRITDADDFIVLHMVNHVLTWQMPDGTFKHISLEQQA
jgi:hypothetical protein